MPVPPGAPIINTVMNDTHKLTLLTSLIRTYFSDDLQFDETPAAAKKRMKLRLAILELSEDPYAARATKEQPTQ